MLREPLGPSGLLLSTKPIEPLLEQTASQASELPDSVQRARFLILLSGFWAASRSFQEPADGKQAGETLPISLVKEKALGT